jgi:hypothetical protein
VGVYFVNVDLDDWANDDVMAGVRGALAAGLAQRGLAPYHGPPPEVLVGPDDGDHFEEKLFRDNTGFARVLREHFDGTPIADLPYWSMIIPVAFEGLVKLAVPSSYDDTTTVGSSFEVRTAMTALADWVRLPAALVPRRSDSLDITAWFDEVEAGTVGVPSGPWLRDLDTAFYVAMFLRAAEFSIQRSCPMRYV